MSLHSVVSPFCVVIVMWHVMYGTRVYVDFLCMHTICMKRSVILNWITHEEKHKINYYIQMSKKTLKVRKPTGVTKYKMEWTLKAKTHASPCKESIIISDWNIISFSMLTLISCPKVAMCSTLDTHPFLGLVIYKIWWIRRDYG